MSPKDDKEVEMKLQKSIVEQVREVSNIDTLREIKSSVGKITTASDSAANKAKADTGPRDSSPTPQNKTPKK